MRWPTRVRMFLRSLLRRGKIEAELEDEMREHLQLEIENNIRAGMSPDEAKIAAQRLTGPVSLYKEQCRDSRSTVFFENCARDFRYAARTLGRTPLFTAAAILTLALGIGANTTVFTFVENILLRSLAVPQPEQLTVLNWGGMVNISYPNYVDFRDRNNVFSNVIAYRLNPASVSLQSRENVRLWGYEATGNYFETLGVKPELGRFFAPDEDKTPGANPAVVISHRCWQTRFAADPHIVGSSVKIDGFPFTVIGVAPPGFSGTELIFAAEFWVPMSMESQVEPGNDWLQSRGSQEVWSLGRLKSGVSRQQAEADLDRVARQLAQAYPNDLDKAARFQLSRPGLVGRAFRDPITGFGIAFMAIAAIGLLLACTNLAGMLLARAADRRREIGIRLALGVSRLHLLRQLVIESLLLAVGGGCLGFTIAYGACQLFSSWRPDVDLPISTALHPDYLVLSFTAIAALMTTALFGLAPALHAIRTDLIPSLKNEPASHRLRRWSIRDLVVAGQMALSVVLVICSALVVRSLQQALTLDLGFNPAGAVSVSVDLGLQGYDEQHIRQFNAELLRKASALSGLEYVGLISNMPLRIGENNEVFWRADRPLPKPSERRGAVIYTISPGYLRAAGTRLVSGRDVNDFDRKGALPVAIVNEALAQVIFGTENPLGKHIRLSMDPPGVEIVGVVETGKYESLGEDPKPAVFLPFAQTGAKGLWTTLVARTPLPPSNATEILRKAVLDLDPNLTLFNVGSLKDQLALPLFPARIAAIVLGVFGALAALLAATGLFALMAYTVAQRRHEIGVRMALGARSGQVLSSIFRRTFVLCAAGIGVGVIITLLAGKLLSGVLYGVSPRDPVAYVSALFLMIAVAIFASWNPAARAVRTDPARTLRED